MTAPHTRRSLPPTPRWVPPAAVAAAVLAALKSGPPLGLPGITPGTHGAVGAQAGLIVLAVALILASPAARAPDRRAWRLLAAGLLLYGLAATWLGLRVIEEARVPVPYWTDGIWMVAYGCLSCGVLLVGRGPGTRPSKSAFVDGLLVALAVMTLASATVLDEHVRGVGSDFLRSATALSYPLWDLLILGVITGAFVGRGWRRPDLRWLVLATGMLLIVTADIAYLRRAADGVFPPSSWYHALYFVGWTTIPAAAWVPSRSSSPREMSYRWRLVAPGLVAGVICLVLVWDHFERRSEAVIVLSCLAFLAVLVRIVMTFAELERLSDARRLAVTDDLTSLPNRRGLLAALGHHATAARESREQFALLVLDIDRFKDLNDTLGHHVGDRMLTEIARRLRTTLHVDEVVARLGGDEFAVVTRRCARADEWGESIALQVREAFVEPIDLDGVLLPTRASVGLALFPEHGTDAAALLRRADVAMYQAKALRSAFEVYDAERDGHSAEMLALGAELHMAPERGELRLEFQPIHEAGTGRVLRAEALVRWQHPTRGLLMPGLFIPVAERTGAMSTLTPAVMKMAAAQCVEWCRAGARLGIAVNVAASDLLDAGFVDAIRAVLDETGLDADLLHVEITEHGILTDQLRAVDVLRALRGLGVHVSIDDFGTGYASISYLRGLPADELKLDRSLVADLAANPDDAAIVRATIILGHELGLRVVVEGIEDAATLERVTAWGADAVQGFHLARPMPGERIVSVAMERVVGRP